MTSLGKAIKLVRISRSLTQTELANAANVSVSYLSLLERNKRDPTFSTVVKIATALNISLVLLLFLSSNNNKALGTELRDKLSYAAYANMKASSNNDD